MENQPETPQVQAAELQLAVKKRKWKKIVLIIILVFALLIAAYYFLPTILGLFMKDASTANDADLMLGKVVVPDGDNAYYDLIKVDKVIYEPEDKSDIIKEMAAGKMWDKALAEEIISKNTEAYNIFSEAARKPKFQDPASADLATMRPDTILPPMNKWRRMAQLSAVKAIYLAKQGSEKEAMDEAFNSIKVGHLIQRSQPFLIEYLVGTRVKDVGLEAVRDIAVSSKLGSKELISYIQALEPSYENEEGLVKAFKSEYITQAWAIDAIGRRDAYAVQELFGFGPDASEDKSIMRSIQSSYYFQPNNTKSLIAGHWRDNIKRVTDPCSEIKAVDIEMLTPSYTEKLYSVKLYFMENAVGKMLNDVLAASMITATHTKCEEDILISAVQAITAIKAYKTDHGNYPDTLGILVPAYLESVPSDPYGEGPLKYDVRKMIIYSVGQDLQDSGGSEGDDWRRMPDPTFLINF